VLVEWRRTLWWVMVMVERSGVVGCGCGVLEGAEDMEWT
jgi:hypothetical protein